MSNDIFNPHEYSCWITGGKPRSKGLVYTEAMDRAALRDKFMNARKRYLLRYRPQYVKKLLNQ